MDVQYSEYELIPRKRANRLTSLDVKRGVFLRVKTDKGFAYADYFPHAVFGDRSVDQFLKEFHLQKNEYDQKILWLLTKDSEYQSFIAKDFFNHQLWTGVENLRSPVVKYKIMDQGEDFFLTLLEKDIRIRFDGNALFSREELNAFMAKIPASKIALVDYMEDPMKDKNWSNLPVKSGRDFIEGIPFDYYIYKPNAEFYPETEAKVIFSGYMGSELGFWHAYCEMIERGDQKEIHGLVVEDFYADQKKLFLGDYRITFKPDLNVVKEIYSELERRTWKPLCSI